MAWVEKEINAVYLGETQVRPQVIEEKIVLKIRANNQGGVPIPVAGYTTSFGYGASYNWYYQVDDGAKYTASGTSRSGGYIWVLTGATPGTDHIVTITPVTEGYGWARAFAFYGTGVESLLQEIIYDSSYMGYAVSETDAGGCFRCRQYEGCTAITYSPGEYLPDTVTTIGQYFRYCQYQNCSNITEIKGWKDLSIGNSTMYRYNQYYNCNKSKTVKVLGGVGFASYNSNSLPNSYVSRVSVPSANLQAFKDATTQPRVSITDSKFV